MMNRPFFFPGSYLGLLVFLLKKLRIWIILNKHQIYLKKIIIIINIRQFQKLVARTTTIGRTINVLILSLKNETVHLHYLNIGIQLILLT